MKYWIPGILFLLIFIASCESFLEEDPKSFITPEEFFIEDRDAESAVNAIYSHLDGESVYAQYQWLVQALLSDNGYANGNDPDYYQFSDFTLTPENPVVQDIWNGLYAGINTANFAIANIPNTPISVVEQELFIAEARFLRGMFYFDLVRYFGDVPIQTAPITDLNDVKPVARAPKDSVYAFMIRDFNFARELLPDTRSDGRPSSFTAIALLAKAYASQGEFSKAFPFSRALILSNQFALLDNYNDVFKVANNYSGEIIFSIPLSTESAGTVNTRSLPPELNGKSLELPTGDLFNDFDSGDFRKSVSFINQVIDPDSNVVEIAPHVIKFWDKVAEPGGGPTANNLPLIRFADILLLHAEIVNEINNGPTSEALFVINLVRERAGLPGLSGMGQDQFREDVLSERRRELAWEGHRWFDLIRFGKLQEKVATAKPGVAVSSTHELLPIPLVEINLNPLSTQNPGY